METVNGDSVTNSRETRFLNGPLTMEDERQSCKTSDKKVVETVNCQSNDSAAKPSLNRYLNGYYEFCDKSFVEEFNEFNSERGLTNFFFVLLYFMTFIVFPSTISELIPAGRVMMFGHEHNGHNSSTTLTITLVCSVANVVLCCSSVVCGWFIVHRNTEYTRKFSLILQKGMRKFRRCLTQMILFSVRGSVATTNSDVLNTADHSGHYPSSRTGSLHNRTNSETNSILSARKIELSILREFSGRSGIIQHSKSSTIRVSPTPPPSFFAAVPEEGSFCSGAEQTRPVVSVSPAEDNDIHVKPSIHLLQRFCITPQLPLLYLILTEMVFILSFVQHGIEPCEHPYATSFSLYHLAGCRLCSLGNFYVSYHAICLPILSYLLFVAMPELSISSIWLAMSSTLIVLIAMALYLSTPNAAFTIIVATAFAITITIDMQIHKVQMFLTTRKLGGILADNERKALETHAQEMRHMIGNVAHDLKTVSDIFQ